MPQVGEFEAIAKGLYLEGLAVDYARNVIWYSDVIAGGIHGVKPDGTKVATLNPDRMWTGGVLMNADGCVLSSGEGGIMWNDPDTGRSGWLLAEIDGKPINGINEMMPDGTGGMFFGSVDIEQIKKGEATRPATIWRITANGVVSVAADGLGFANGIMLSPDERVLYVTNGGSVLAFDVAADGGVTNRRDFATLEAGGNGDGIAIDAAGGLYVTSQPGVQVFDRDGTYLGLIATPRNAISVAFAGRDKKTLYIVGSGALGADGKEFTTPDGVRNNAKTIYKLSMLAEGLKGRAK